MDHNLSTVNPPSTMNSSLLFGRRELTLELPGGNGVCGRVLREEMSVPGARVVLESIDRRHRDEPDSKKAALQGARGVMMTAANSRF